MIHFWWRYEVMKKAAIKILSTEGQPICTTLKSDRQTHLQTFDNFTCWKRTILWLWCWSEKGIILMVLIFLIYRWQIKLTLPSIIHQKEKQSAQVLNLTNRQMVENFAWWPALFLRTGMMKMRMMIVMIWWLVIMIINNHDD